MWFRAMIQPLMGVYFKQFCFSKIGGVGGGLVAVLLNVLLKMCHKSALGLTDMIYFFICNIAWLSENWALTHKLFILISLKVVVHLK